MSVIIRFQNHETSHNGFRLLLTFVGSLSCSVALCCFDIWRCNIIACNLSLSFWSCSSNCETTCIWTLAWAVDLSSRLCSLFRCLNIKNDEIKKLSSSFYTTDNIYNVSKQTFWITLVIYCINVVTEECK